MKIFVAGATGAVGLPLVRALRALGHDVSGMTRSGLAVDRLRELGARPYLGDAFDREAVLAAMRDAKPEIVIDQLTYLPADPADLMKSMPIDTRLHREGGGNLLAAARDVGVRRYMLQSRGFYLDAAAGSLADEAARLRYDAPGEIGESCRAIGAYEDAALMTPDMDGVVLRYGFFYGPGTWYWPDGAAADYVRKAATPIIGEGNAVWSFVHLDDAIAATVAAIDAAPGVYNIVDDDPLPVGDWLPAFARWVNAPAPPQLSIEEAMRTAGHASVYYHTQLTGASNARAIAELGFNPRPLVWKGA